jgi:peptidoglycan/xylan/chitin deacetylase (PgdA/CDA1 family)
MKLISRSRLAKSGSRDGARTEGHARLREFVGGALGFSPIQPVFNWRANHVLTVLAYHGVENPLNFVRQLDYLCKETNLVSLDEVVDAMNCKIDLPPRPVLITFDDSGRSLLEDGMPLLAERRIPAVAFIVAGALDTDLPYWFVEVENLIRGGGTTRSFPDASPATLKRILKQIPDDERLAILDELRTTSTRPLTKMPQLRSTELLQLEAAGIAIGNHSLTHPCLARCSNGKIREEIEEADRVITEIVGRRPKAFSYPNGDVDDRVMDGVARAGHEIAFLFDHRVNLLPVAEPLAVSRVRVSSTTSLPRFRIIVSGFLPALLHLRGLA